MCERVEQVGLDSGGPIENGIFGKPQHNVPDNPCTATAAGRLGSLGKTNEQVSWRDSISE